MRKLYTRVELTQYCRVGDDLIVECIEQEWITPAEAEKDLFDDEDLARMRLIRHLRQEVGANSEAVSVILHLVDQLHSLQNEIRARIPKDPSPSI